MRKIFKGLPLHCQRLPHGKTFSKSRNWKQLWKCCKKTGDFLIELFVEVALKLEKSNFGKWRNRTFKGQ